MNAAEQPEVGDAEVRPPRHAAAVIATIAVIFALYAGHDFLVPVCLALLLTALLVPAVAWLVRHHLPVTVAAMLTVLAFLAVLVGAGAALEVPVRGMVRDIPKTMSAARKRLAAFREPLARIGIHLDAQRPQPAGGASARTRANAAPHMDSARRDSIRPDSARATAPNDSGNAETPGDRGAGMGAPADSTASTASPRDTGARGSAAGARSGQGTSPNGGAGGSGSSGASSGVSSSGVLSAVGQTFGVTAELLSELVEVLLLAAFLLAGGAAWGAKLAEAVPDDTTRHRTLAAVVEMRAAVARYITVTALINLGQGVVVALALWGLGVPSPLLWGALTFLLEFVPYLGGLAMVVLLLIAGLASGGSVMHALLGPLSYLAVTTLQNNLVSPAAYGRGLRLNPAAILIAVMFWYTMWGVAGAFLAVPILAALRILTTKIPALAPVTPFLEE